MKKFFISGFVMDDQLASGVGGVSLRASLTGTKAANRIITEGVSGPNGSFALEFRVPEEPSGGALLVEAVRGDEKLASHTLPPALIENGSAHVLLTISSKPSEPSKPSKPSEPPEPSKPSESTGFNLIDSFPIGVPGHDRSPAHQGTSRVAIDLPKDIPKHPMAALPFLLAASQQRDSFEEEGRGEALGRPSITRDVDPDSSSNSSSPP